MQSNYRLILRMKRTAPRISLCNFSREQPGLTVTLLLAVLEATICLILVCWPDAVVLKHMVMASNTVNEMISAKIR